MDKHLKIKISEKSLTQRFDVSMTSFSNEKTYKRPQEVQRKTRLFNLRNVVYKEKETKPEHAIGLYPRKNIYLDILITHTQLHAKYVTYCLLFNTSPCIY